MKTTTLSRATQRLVWLLLSGVLTALGVWLTGEYSTAVWYPVVYLVVTTVRDLADKNIRNK